MAAAAGEGVCACGGACTQVLWSWHGCRRPSECCWALASSSLPPSRLPSLRRHPPACGGGPVPLALCLPPHLPFPNLWLGPPLFLLIGSFHPSPLPMRRSCAGMFSGGGRSAALTHPQFSTGAPPPPCGGCGAPVAALVRPAPLQPLSAPLPHPSLHPLPPLPCFSPCVLLYARFSLLATCTRHFPPPPWSLAGT